MKNNKDVYVPDYYPAFECRGGACAHTCCVGWEIDIDEESAARYRKEGGAFGEKLRQNMKDTEGTLHFALSEDGRCPFLTKENLCEMYIELGGEALCQICTDHPRYRNFYSFGMEMGLGLCCEKAAELILAETAPPKYILLSGDGKKKPTETEERFFELRKHLLDMAFDTSLVPEMRLFAICKEFGLTVPEKDVFSLYNGLTVLNASWRETIKRLKTVKTPTHYSAFPQLFAYFLCRHFTGGLLDGRLSARLLFALHAADTILRLAPCEAAVLETARRFAEEIEYAEENIEAIIDFLA